MGLKTLSALVLLLAVGVAAGVAAGQKRLGALGDDADLDVAGGRPRRAATADDVNQPQTKRSPTRVPPGTVSKRSRGKAFALRYRKRRARATSISGQLVLRACGKGRAR